MKSIGRDAALRRPISGVDRPLRRAMLINSRLRRHFVIERSRNRGTRSTTSDSSTSARDGTVGCAQRRHMQKGHDVEQSLVVFDHHQTLASDNDVLPAANKNSSATAQLDRERNKRRRADKLSQFLKHAELSLLEPRRQPLMSNHWSSRHPNRLVQSRSVPRRDS
jgi:hypothetical protein